MEENRIMTRLQARLSVAGDENTAAMVSRKDVAQPKTRRPLGNLTNKPAKGLNVVDKNNCLAAKKPPVSGVVTRRQSQAEAARLAAASHAVPDDNDENDAQPDRMSLEEAAESSPADLRASAAVPASPIPDVDSGDLGDCHECAEYAADIYTFYRMLEPSIRVPPEYMNQQRYVTRQMRAVLVDWMVDVHHKFKLLPESLFLAIWVLDKFLSKQEVERRNLQLTGVAALVIANKYEEVYGPTLRDYETICAGAYTRADILRMERAILKILDFDITVPTTFTFLTRYLKVSAYNRHPEFGHLAQYLCEWALLSNTCLQWSASLIAASAIYACFKAFSLNEEDNDWPRRMRKHTGYTIAELHNCASYLVNLMDKASVTQYRSLHHKFKRKEYSSVARYKAPRSAFATAPPSVEAQ